MSLRDQARADAQTILEDVTGGFATPVTFTSPDGATAVINGHATDISQTLDPSSGLPVSGREASVAVSRAALTAAGLDLPVHVANKKRRAWLVEFADVDGNTQRWKVREVMPDRELGVIVCMLEFYRE